MHHPLSSWVIHGHPSATSSGSFSGWAHAKEEPISRGISNLVHFSKSPRFVCSCGEWHIVYVTPAAGEPEPVRLLFRSSPAGPVRLALLSALPRLLRQFRLLLPRLLHNTRSDPHNLCLCIMVCPYHGIHVLGIFLWCSKTMLIKTK